MAAFAERSSSGSWFLETRRNQCFSMHCDCLEPRDQQLISSLWTGLLSSLSYTMTSSPAHVSDVPSSSIHLSAQHQCCDINWFHKTTNKTLILRSRPAWPFGDLRTRTMILQHSVLDNRISPVSSGTNGRSLGHLVKTL